MEIASTIESVCDVHFKQKLFKEAYEANYGSEVKTYVELPNLIFNVDVGDNSNNNKADNAYFLCNLYKLISMQQHGIIDSTRHNTLQCDPIQKESTVIDSAIVCNKVLSNVPVQKCDEDPPLPPQEVTSRVWESHFCTGSESAVIHNTLQCDPVQKESTVIDSAIVCNKVLSNVPVQKCDEDPPLPPQEVTSRVGESHFCTGSESAVIHNTLQYDPVQKESTVIDSAIVCNKVLSNVPVQKCDEDLPLPPQEVGREVRESRVCTGSEPAVIHKNTIVCNKAFLSNVIQNSNEYAMQFFHVNFTSCFQCSFSMLNSLVVSSAVFHIKFTSCFQCSFSLFKLH
jgi:hypothetical protein